MGHPPPGSGGRVLTAMSEPSRSAESRLRLTVPKFQATGSFSWRHVEFVSPSLAKSKPASQIRIGRLQSRAGYVAVVGTLLSKEANRCGPRRG